jgi:hypothetical protein
VSVDGADIRHRCDTLPGSSGSPILSEGSGRMLGLHYGGSPNPGPSTWNFGKRLSEIATRSRVLSAALAEQRQQEDVATRAAAARTEAERRQQEAAMRAEVERRVKEQLEAERAKAAPAVAATAPRAAPAAPATASAPRQPVQDGRWMVEFTCGKTIEHPDLTQLPPFSVKHEARMANGRLAARHEYPFRLPGFTVVEEWSGEYRDNRFAMRISARATSPQSRDVHQWEYEWTGGALQRLPRQRIGLEGALFSFPKGSKMKSRSCEGALSVLEG